MEELREQVRRFVSERDWAKFHSPKNLSMALSVEVAEVVEHFQWLTEEESRALPPERLARVRDEVGDVLLLLVNLSDKLGIDPIAAAKDKLATTALKYPPELVRGSARKYDDYDAR